jgi:hypothetical protein
MQTGPLRATPYVRELREKRWRLSPAVNLKPRWLQWVGEERDHDDDSDQEQQSPEEPAPSTA